MAENDGWRTKGTKKVRIAELEAWNREISVEEKKLEAQKDERERKHATEKATWDLLHLLAKKLQ